MGKRRDYFAAASGAVCYVLSPELSDIRLSDIAIGLARQNRFNGHYREDILGGYSVAQHSLFVSYKCNPGDARYGLWHDAAEAYLGDMIGPMKYLIADYSDIEAAWLREIGLRFGLPMLGVKPPSVREADHRALVQEAHDVLVKGPSWSWGEKPWPQEMIRPMMELEARNAWLRREWELT